MSYENGVESFKFGDDTGNNLWLNQENMYIVDEDEVENIYNELKGLEAYSFEGKTIIDPALDVGDKIIIDNKPVIYQGELDFQTRFIAEISSKIAIKQKQETTVKTTSQKVINRRVQSRIDEAEGKITQLIEETSETSQKLTKVEQTIDGITQTVSSVETKIEQVEDKADNAQSTADSATQKAETAQDTADIAKTNAQNAQSTADGAVSQITTTNQKVSQIEQTVNGITQSVSEVEEKVETVETKADNAQSTANTANQNAQNAQNTANNINNNLTQNYYTKTETNSQINQKADSITSEVSKTYSTKTETTNAKNEAINSANSSTDKKLQDYTEIEKLGTLIEQNWEHVKVAWNQISQYIQLEGDNGDATMGFYDNNTKFAEMGVNTIDDDRYISFAIPVDYSQSISDGMAWGVQTKSDNKFYPILYVKNFTMQDENSEGCTGELVLDGCDLVLGAINSGIISNNVKIHGDALPGIYFTDTSTGRMLLGIIPANGISEDSIYILDNISFYRNAAGSNSFKIGNDNGCLFSDDGHILCENLNCNQNVYIYGYLDAIQGIRTQGYVSGKAFIDNSREETKKNIEKFNKNAVEIIKNTDIYEFNYKTEKENAKKHLGFVIGENYNYVKEITAEDDESKEIGADLYSMISVAYKAIQEQQDEIDKLKETIKAQQEQINKLLEDTE